jgi:hypothetical protein
MDTPPDYQTSAMFSSGSMISLGEQTHRSLAKNIQMYKLAQSKILGSTFANLDNRNSTFGRPSKNDKFNRKTFAKEFKTEMIGK